MTSIPLHRTWRLRGGEVGNGTISLCLTNTRSVDQSNLLHQKRGPRRSRGTKIPNQTNQPECPTRVTSFASKVLKYRAQLSGAFRQDKDTKLLNFDGRPGWSTEV